MAGRQTPVRKLELEERRRQVAQMYLAHMTQAEIARRLDVHQTTVGDDIAAIKSQWKIDRESLLEREAAELDQMERDCAVQFASTKGREWMSERREIKKSRAALLGLNAAQKVEGTGEDGAIKVYLFNPEQRSGGDTGSSDGT